MITNYTMSAELVLAAMGGEARNTHYEPRLGMSPRSAARADYHRVLCRGLSSGKRFKIRSVSTCRKALGYCSGSQEVWSKLIRVYQ